MARQRDPIPAKRRTLRTVATDYQGPMFFVDIDKTYLLTRFESPLAMAKIPFEGAQDKRPNPGMPALLSSVTGRGYPLFFISASPPQLGKVLLQRMELDGVRPSGVTFKDQLRLLFRGRPRKLVKHVGFKLKALLEYRCELPAQARWILIGDDAESDAMCYSLFADLCAGRWPGYERARVWEKLELEPRESEALEALLLQAPAGDPVERIVILRTRTRARRDLESYGGRLQEARNPMVAALLLLEAGVLEQDEVLRVAAELYQLGLEAELLAAICDARKRGLLAGPTLAGLIEACQGRGYWPDFLELQSGEDASSITRDGPCLPADWLRGGSSW